MKNGNSVKFPADSAEAVKLLKAIPEIALKGEADVDVVIGANPTKPAFEDVLGIRLLQIMADVAKKIEKDPELMQDVLKAFAKKYEGQLDDGKTLVAEKDGQIITGLERLEPYIKKATSLQQYKGLKALINRCFAMKKKPKHSVEDLLDFLSYADLPIADDGSIIGYKMVNRTNGGYYVDCHSGRVKQDVRYRVFMAPEMVDPDRSNECSQGLHIASRGYLKGFSGDACLLVKFNPEDVIAVPHGDPQKIRVCSYEVLAVLPQKLMQLVASDKPMTSEKAGKELLAKAISCQFPPACLTTEIKGAEGTNCEYGECEEEKPKVEKRKVSPKEATSLDTHEDIDSKVAKSNLDKAKELNNKIKEVKAKALKVEHPLKELRQLLNVPPGSRISEVDYYYADALRMRLKKSWEALGVDHDQLLFTPYI